MDLADISSESRWYKDDLLRFASQLRRWHEVNRWSEKRIYEYEREILCHFTIVRKLRHTLTICDSVKTRKYPVIIYKGTGTKVDYMNSHKIDKLYNFDTPQTEMRDLNFICNQIVHSFIFCILFSEDKKSSTVLVSSDEKRHKELYGFSTAIIDEILRQFGSCYPNIVSLTRMYDSTGNLTGKMKFNTKCENLVDCKLPPVFPKNETP